MTALTYKQIRQAAGLSISQIADYLGVSPRMVRYYEAGGRVPSKSVERLYNQIQAKETTYCDWRAEKIVGGK